jgi:hypothetical protein
MNKVPPKTPPAPDLASLPATEPSFNWQPQIWISLSSAVIALCALSFSIYNGWLQRQSQKLSVRPRMTVSFFYNDQGSGFLFGGTGIGYATLKSFDVLVDGKAQHNWTEMCRALGFATKPSFEFVVPRPETIFKPDSYEKVFWIASGPYSEELKLKADRIIIKSCYCSIYDECWRVDSQNQVPEALSSCPQQLVTFTSPPRIVRLP